MQRKLPVKAAQTIPVIYRMHSDTIRHASAGHFNKYLCFARRHLVRADIMENSLGRGRIRLVCESPGADTVLMLEFKFMTFK